MKSGNVFLNEISILRSVNSDQMKHINEKNIRSANTLLSGVNMLSFIGVFIVWFLGRGNVLFVDDYMNKFMIVCGVLYLAPILLCLYYNGGGKVIKWILLTTFVIANTLISIYCIYGLEFFLLVIPIMFACRYYSLTTVVVESALCLAGSTAYLYVSPKFGLLRGYIDVCALKLPEKFTLFVDGSIVDSLNSQGFISEDALRNYSTQTMIVLFCSLFCISVVAAAIAGHGKVILIRAMYALEEQKTLEFREEELRTRLMLSQIQPHFLFNSLSTISALCTASPERAKKATNDFADYLRGNLSSLISERLTDFESELDHTETYLRLEKLRFGDDMEVVYDIQAKDFDIPALSLQPIVENAVKYGVCGNEDGGKIEIRTYVSDGWIYIVVSDDGPGFSPSSYLSDGKQHIGIVNVRKRLENLVGGSLEIKSSPGGGTVATIRIPEKKNPDKEEA